MNGGNGERAEIANDTGSYKTLMILGNKSADGGTRRVGIWDRLDVNGTHVVNGRLCVGGTCVDETTFGKMARMSSAQMGDAVIYLNGSGGPTSKTQRVNFNPALPSTPQVYVSIFLVNDTWAPGRDMRINVTAQNVSNTGFDLLASTWSDSVIYALGARWLAMPT